MLKKNKRFLGVILGVLLASTISSIKPVYASAASSRLWGQDRYETAVAISKQGWTSSDYVIIASGEGYADALCAAPLAKKYNAPILLTEGSTLNSKTAEELKRLDAKHVFVIGKYGSVSQVAENQLSTIVEDVKRLGGNDRYETSVIVAKELGSVDKVAVTSGYGFADALSIAPIAAQQNMPILLTGKDQLPGVIQNYIKDNSSNIKNAYIVGGQGVISDSAAQQVSSTAVRLYGKDRFETNLNVMKYFKDQLKFDSLYVVQADGPTGKEFADALSGAALAAKTSSPLVLTYKTTSQDVEDFLKLNAQSNTAITALGGTAAVSENLIIKLNSAISNGTVTTPENPGTPQSGGTPIGGGSTGGSTNDSTNQELRDIVNKLNSILPNLQSDNEKTIVNKIIASINKTIADSSYDYKADADEVRKLKDNLTEDEKNDLISKISGKISKGTLLELAIKFGLL